MNNLTMESNKIIGSRINQYILVDEIGRGGHGVVYQGYHETKTNEALAIKIIEDTGNLDLLLIEPELLSQLNHPNIIGLKDYFIHAGKLVLVTEYINGINLQSYLEQQGRLTVSEVVNFLTQMADALKNAHANNIIHRDIKLSNILVTGNNQNQRFVLVDFGVSRMAEGVQTVKRIAGTYYYMAPEQLRGRPCEQSDLWALGVCAYTLLTSIKPFEAKVGEELSHQILFSIPQAPGEIVGKIEPELENIIFHLLEKQLINRTASANELLDELRELPEASTKNHISDKKIHEFQSQIKENKQPIHSQSGVRKYPSKFQNKKKLIFLIIALLILVFVLTNLFTNFGIISFENNPKNFLSYTELIQKVKNNEVNGIYIDDQSSTAQIFTKNYKEFVTKIPKDANNYISFFRKNGVRVCAKESEAGNRALVGLLINLMWLIPLIVLLFRIYQSLIYSGDRLWNISLTIFLIVIVIALGTAFFDKQPQNRETWCYSQFIQEVEKGNVAQVKITTDRTHAIVKSQSGNQVLVTLVNDSNLIDTLMAKNVEISVLPQTDEGFWFKAISSLFFPIILLIGLFTIARPTFFNNTHVYTFFNNTYVYRFEHKNEKQTRNIWIKFWIFTFLASLPNLVIPDMISIGGLFTFYLGQKNRKIFYTISGVLIILLGFWVSLEVESIFDNIFDNTQKVNSSFSLFRARTLISTCFLFISTKIFIEIKRLKEYLLIHKTLREASQNSEKIIYILKSYVDTDWGNMNLRQRYIELLLLNKRFEEAIVESKLALDIDAYNFGATLFLVHGYFEVGLYEKCIEVCNGYLSVSNYSFEFSDMKEKCEQLLEGEREICDLQ